MSDIGVHCDVIAPTSIPCRRNERIKTDRRDAEKLARYYAAGLLTPVHVPDAAWIEARGLVRLRIRLVNDKTRWRNRLLLMLRSRGHVYRGGRAWTQKFDLWLNRLELGRVNSLTVRTILTQLDVVGAQITDVEAHI